MAQERKQNGLGCLGRGLLHGKATPLSRHLTAVKGRERQPQLSLGRPFLSFCVVSLVSPHSAKAAKIVAMKNKVTHNRATHEGGKSVGLAAAAYTDVEEGVDLFSLSKALLEEVGIKGRVDYNSLTVSQKHAANTLIDSSELEIDMRDGRPALVARKVNPFYRFFAAGAR